MRRIISIPLWIGICFAVGLTASYFQNESLQVWYPMLQRSVLTPPNIVFPIVWSILYLLMGISAGLVTASTHAAKRMLIAIFIIQLTLNFMWCIFFFALRNPMLGFIDIILLDVAVLLYVVRSREVSRAASYLFIPYILWLLVASYLNGYILMNN